MKRNVGGVVITVAGLVALLGSTACVSSGKYKTLQAERDALAGKNTSLQGELSAANEKSAACDQEKGACTSQNEALQKQIAQNQESMNSMGSQMTNIGTQLRQREEENRKLKSTYDGLVGSLQKELASGQIQVQQLRDGLSVNVAQEILFASGSASLDKQGQEVLKRVAEQLGQTDYQIVVTGHTDNKPVQGSLKQRYPTNWELGGARAASVVRLFAESGLKQERLLAVSMGDTRPLDSNDTPDGRKHNRRIEIRLRPVVIDQPA